jgi:hypothetical protein
MFYLGVVEDNLDPLKLGRLKIRVFGLHTENRAVENNFQFIATADLPWSYPAAPITNSSIDGISDFSTIIPGTKVFVFFLDQYHQKPFYFAVMPFILDEMPNFQMGFSDPTEQHPSEEFKDESSISRLARAENLDETCIKTKTDNKTTWDIVGTDIEEPDPPYEAEYPHNRVIETPGGHVIEIDSTPGGERIHVYHPTGTYDEIGPAGDRVKKTIGNEYDIVLLNKNAYVKGSLTLKVDGDAVIDVKGSTLLNCQGDLGVSCEKKTSITCTDQALVTLKAASEIQAENTLLINALENLTVSSAKKVLIQSTDNTEITATKTAKITASQNVELTSTGETKVNSTGNLTITGANTQLTANGTLTITSTGACTINPTGSLTLTSASTVSLTSTGAGTLNVTSAGPCNISGTSIGITGSANVTITGAFVQLN